jgi:hypothetical protein
MFDKPDAPGRDSDAPQFSMEQHLGDLLVLQVRDAQDAVETEYGTRPCITADVHVIDPAGHIATEYPEAWLFGTVLFSQLKGKRGRTVLGVLEQGEKRPGRKPPWRLADPTDRQEEVAIRAMATRPDAAAEEAPPAQRAADPWGIGEEQPATVGAADKAPWE